MQDPILYGVYVARLFSKHPLALSIFLNNYGLLYLVNDKHLLVPGSFRLAYDKYVEAETILFPIKGHGTCIIKNVAAVAQQCIEEGVNLKVWVETRVYFKILS
jgi:hypothetical protein